jgi:(heptosyl)LPS beta-1,4-glucosyltransferase
VVILTKNEEKMIEACLGTVRWAAEVIVIDTESTDSTVKLAKKHGAMVYTVPPMSFSQWRNYGLKKVRQPWVFYLDADERVTTELYEEIRQLIEQDIAAIGFKRENIHYGKHFQHGGWENDLLHRLFKVEALSGWTGEVHETAQYTGESAVAKHPLIHLTHRNMVDGLYKTIEWTGIEAQLLLAGKSPRVTAMTLLRKMKMEFIRRYFLKKGYRDGVQGMIEALVQAMNRFIVYARLWELQQKPSLEETYQKIDQKLLQDWEKEK